MRPLWLAAPNIEGDIIPFSFLSDDKKNRTKRRLISPPAACACLLPSPAVLLWLALILSAVKLSAAVLLQERHVRQMENGGALDQSESVLWW